MMNSPKLTSLIVFTMLMIALALVITACVLAGQGKPQADGLLQNGLAVMGGLGTLLANVGGKGEAQKVQVTNTENNPVHTEEIK